MVARLMLFQGLPLGELPHSMADQCLLLHPVVGILAGKGRCWKKTLLAVDEQRSTLSSQSSHCTEQHRNSLSCPFQGILSTCTSTALSGQSMN